MIGPLIYRLSILQIELCSLRISSDNPFLRKSELKKIKREIERVKRDMAKLESEIRFENRLNSASKDS